MTMIKKKMQQGCNSNADHTGSPVCAGSGANIGGRDGRASRPARVHAASTAFQMVGAVAIYNDASEREMRHVILSRNYVHSGIMRSRPTQAWISGEAKATMMQGTIIAPRSV